MDSQFADIDILGGDFFQANKAGIESPRVGGVRESFGRWDGLKRDKEATVRAGRGQGVLG